MNWSWFLGLLLALITNVAIAQQADLTLMTPDSGIIRVNWNYQFEWDSNHDLILKLEPPQNIEIQGLLPTYDHDGQSYHIRVNDLFIKEKIVIKGEKGKVLSTQTLMINIKDHQKGIIKADDNCPQNVHVPLFSRAILHIKCMKDGNSYRISEHGHINGKAYDNSYKLKAPIEATVATKVTRPSTLTPRGRDEVTSDNLNGAFHTHSFYAGLGVLALNQKRSEAGDGLVLQGEVSADFLFNDLWIGPRLQLSLLSMLSDTHHSPLKARRDEVELKVIHTSWLKFLFTPSVHTKVVARGAGDHYLMAVAVGGGLAYQMRSRPEASVFFELYPGLSGREYQGMLTGFRYQYKKSEFSIAVNSEKYNGESSLSTKNYGVLLNVVQGF